jgi:predicted MFS family arabinose efflux permease
VAHWLRDRGFEAYAVRGGIAALTGEGLEAELVPAEEATPTPPARVLAALRWPLYRRYSAGVLLSLIGNWVEAAAYGYVVLLLGGSAATLGLIGFLNTIPNLVFALPAGALADRYDRRKLLLIFQSLNMALAAALAVTWSTGTLTVGLLGVLAVLGGILGTLSFAPFQAMLAAMVPRRDLESAVAINSLSLQLARFIGPAIAGFLLAVAGPTWVFGVNAASFVAVLGTLALLPASRPVRSAAATGGGAISEAFRYVFGQRSLAAMMGLMLVAGLFGTPPVAFMIPAIVRYNLHAGAGTLGAITAAIGLGSLLGSIALLRLSGRPNKGEPLLAGFVVTGVALAGIGASTNAWLSLALALVGGFAGVLFVGLSTVVVQAMSTDAFRARALAIWAAAFVGMLPFGALLTGGLAAVIGPGGAVFVDGVAVVVGAIVVVALRPQIAWLGCAALPESCVAGVIPAAVALEVESQPSTA